MRLRSPEPDDALKSWPLMPSSAKGATQDAKKQKTETDSVSVTVDKLQFEPPLRKETEAHSEMVTHAI